MILANGGSFENESKSVMGLIWESVFLDVVAVICVMIAFMYHYLTSTHSFWERLGIPYKKPHVLYGNIEDIIKFRKTHFEVYQEFYNNFKQGGHRFGGIFQLREPVLFVCCPELARDIYVKNFPHFHDRSFVYDEHFDPLSAHLIALEGQKWKFIKSKLNPAFSASKLKEMLAIIRELAEEYMKRLGVAADKEEMVEMRKSCSLYFIDVIGAVAFGIQVDAQRKDSQFLHMGQRFFEPTKWDRITQTVVVTYPWLYKTFKIKTIPKKLTDFFVGVIKDTMDHRRKTNTQRKDFLHFLMKIKEEKGTNLKEMEEMKGVTAYNMTVSEDSIELTEGVIAAQAFLFFIAGYETASSALSSCIHVLAHHPEIQDEIFLEVNQIVAKFGDLTYEAIQNLTYVEQVLQETLRMYPPVGVIIRKCTKPYQLPGTTITIPKGCQTFIPSYSFHHDPEYFPDPQEFRPQRFSPQNSQSLVPYTFMPFGHGPRVCIGQRMAMMEMKLSLALAVKNFKIVKCEKTAPFRIDPKSFFLTPLDGLWVRLIRRENS